MVEAEQQLYLLLGEIKATQALILKKLDEHAAERKELTERVSQVESKINWAAGTLGAIIFVFQAGWAYFTRKVT